MKINMKNKSLIYLSLILLSLFLNSCIKDNFNFDKWDREIQYNGSFAAPAIWGDLAFTDAIKKFDAEAMFITNEDGYISLIYNIRVQSDDVHDIIYLPNQNISGSVNSPDFDFSGFTTPGLDTVSHSFQSLLTFDVFNTEAELKNMLLKSGLMDITAQSTYFHTLRLYISFPTITKNGVPFSRFYTFAYSGESQTNSDIDLTGYNIDMSQTPMGHNEIPVDVRVTLFHSGNPNNSGSLNFNVNIYDLQYDIVQGYFGVNTLIFESDTLDITLFKTKEFNIEDYRFVDPKFKVYYWNSYGVPSAFYFTELRVNSATDGIDYDIIHYGGGIPMDSINPYNVSYALSVGTTMEDSLKVDKNNSNIALIMEKRPQWLKFIAHANTNPMGLDHSNFVTSTSLLEAEIVVELPLWGYIYNFHRRDTIEFDMSDIYNEYNPASRVMARIDIQNGFPVEAFGQVYFVDNNYVVLDSLFHNYEERLLKAALVNSEGRVLDYERKVTKIEFDLNRLEKIKNTKHVILGGQANTTAANNQSVVKIYNDYRIIFDIGFEVDFDVNIDLDTIE